MRSELLLKYPAMEKLYEYDNAKQIEFVAVVEKLTILNWNYYHEYDYKVS